MATDTSASPIRRRRTQAERRAATRAALLDATIECLVESGYANVTTAQIAERAGVTRGAQAHHFSTKGELVIEAIRHLTHKLAAEYVEVVNTRRRSVRRVLDDLFELVWQVHTGPLFAASMELWVAARTDADLRERFADLEADVMRTTAHAAAQVLPDVAVQPVTGPLLNTTMATVRGLAMLTFVDAVDQVEEQWRPAKEQLLDMWMGSIDT